MFDDVVDRASQYEREARRLPVPDDAPVAFVKRGRHVIAPFEDLIATKGGVDVDSGRWIVARADDAVTIEEVR